MFKNRTYVMGLGAGIIAGALLLQVMIVAQSPAPQQPTATSSPLDELDPQKLKEQATKYFQVFDKDVKVYTQADVDKLLQAEKDQQAAATPAAQEPVKRTIVYVQPDLTATSVSELLYRAGIIVDRNAFEGELRKQGATSKIQVGYHVFEGAPDVQTVIDNLITRQ